MVVDKNSDVINFNNPETLSMDKMEKLFVPDEMIFLRNCIVNVNGRDYVYKLSDEESLLNELIGCYLAKLLGIDSVDYQIGVYDDTVYVLSEVLFKEGFNYFYPKTYFGKLAGQDAYSDDDFDLKKVFVKDKILKGIKDKKLLNDVLKLIAIDFKMNQLDRNQTNLIIKEDIEGHSSLAPLYDFEFSYQESLLYPDDYYYDNPLIILKKNWLSLEAFFLRYPNVYRYLRKIKDISVLDILEIISKEKGLIISDEIYEHYKTAEKTANKALKLI